MFSSSLRQKINLLKKDWKHKQEGGTWLQSRVSNKPSYSHLKGHGLLEGGGEAEGVCQNKNTSIPAV